MADLAAPSWSIAEKLGETEETAFVSAVQAGSAEAFERLLNRYHSSVYNVVYRIVGNPQDAADTVQEVFLKVYKGVGKFQGNSSLKTWIFRIAVHEGCNYKRWFRRHAQKETSLETRLYPEDGNDTPKLGETLVDERRSPLELSSSREMRAIIDKALAEIPESYRAAVVLRDLEDFTYEEIAEILNVSLGTVKSRVGRGRDALRKRLTKQLPVPMQAGLRNAVMS